MLTARNVALRVNGVRVTSAALRRGVNEPELVMTDPLLGEFSADESFTYELLELLIPPVMRSKLPNGGWRRVPLRILILLLRSSAVKISASAI